MSKKKKKHKNGLSPDEKKQVQQRPSSKTSLRNYYIAILLLAFVLYGNTLYNKYAFDDSVVITENRYTKKGFEGIPDLVKKDLFAGINGESLELTGGRYRPLSLITHAIEYQLWADKHPGYNHLVNILLFALCCIILFRTLLEVFPRFTLFAFITTLIFMLHPVHTEVVANIKSRDEILCFLFLMLTLFFLFRFIASQERKHFLLSGLFYFLSLFSKENGITFLAVIPLALCCFVKLDLKKATLYTAPFLALAAVYLGIRAGLLDTSRIKESTDLMENPFYGLGLFERLPTVVRIAGKYIGLLFFPHPLSSDYSYSQVPISGWGDVWVLTALFSQAAILVFALKNIAKVKTEEVFSVRTIVSFGILFYFITVSIVSNLFFNIGAPMGERFLFLPSLGFCLAFSALLFFVLKLNLAHALKIPSKLYLPLAAIIVLCSYKTITRNKDWKDNLTLFEKDVKASPNSAKIHYYYGNTMLTQVINDNTAPRRNEFLLKAKDEFYRSISIYPQFHWCWYNLGLIYNDLATSAASRKDSVQSKMLTDSAIYVLNKVLELQPKHINTQGLLGSVYGKLKNDLPKAIQYLQTAVKYKPDDLGAQENLAIAYAMNNNYNEALQSFQKVLQLNPNNPQTYSNIGSLYGNMGDTIKAKEYFAKAKQVGGN